MSPEETTLALSPMDQFRSLAEEEDRSVQELLHEALFLLNRERLRQLDRQTRRQVNPTLTGSDALPAIWAREDLLRDAGLVEDLVTVYRVPQQWQALVDSVKVHSERVSIDP